MTRDLDLSVTVGSVRFPNPVLTASGTAGYGAELGAYVDLSSLGAVVVKSLSAEPWAGNPPPRVHETVGGMLNAVGLHNMGVAAWRREHLPALCRAGARVVASIWGRSVEEYARAAELLEGADVVAVEVNLSCPNLDGGRHLFAQDASQTAAVVAACAPCGLPLWAKLTPNVTDMVPVARAALDAGAEALTLVNTVMGLAIDPARRGPWLAVGGGGLSGPALHPIAVRAVYECRAAFPGAGIVGVGGVARGTDAVELLEAGADAVEVGTATFADPRAPARVLSEVRRWCARAGAQRITDLIGAAHA
ncbi:MAG TPA: dihydroorotate dehydrogenase [Acidimicrobiales bacterium]|nr:dihydroorotate dehydrogenase [Acidimicrobiales bacterium]